MPSRIPADEPLYAAQERIYARGKPTCKNGHIWESNTTRWRFRDRSDRKGHASNGWERDCLTCKEVSRGTTNTGMRTKSWLPGATNG